METNKFNLLENLPSEFKEEIFDVLCKSGSVQIERITSSGQSSPQGFWYDQDNSEWVILLKGSACLEFEDSMEIVLKPFDYLLIPAHKKHRVKWTSSEETCVWLAVHF